MQRWWTGHDWTDQTAPLAAPAPLPGERPRLADDVPVYGAYIWLVTVLPFVTLPLLFLFDPSPLLAIAAQGTSQGATAVATQAAQQFLVWYFVAAFAGFVLFALSVLFSYLDWRQLGRLGVVRPFHWAWSFLSAGVYVIGRSVIVRKVARPRGLTPVWVLIALYVVAIIVVTIWTVMFVSAFLQFALNHPQFASPGA